MKNCHKSAMLFFSLTRTCSEQLFSHHFQHWSHKSISKTSEFPHPKIIFTSSLSKLTKALESQIDCTIGTSKKSFKMVVWQRSFKIGMASFRWWVSKSLMYFIHTSFKESMQYFSAARNICALRRCKTLECYFAHFWRCDLPLRHFQLSKMEYTHKNNL